MALCLLNSVGLAHVTVIGNLSTDWDEGIPDTSVEYLSWVSDLICRVPIKAI
jgi:hypothetical protein